MRKFLGLLVSGALVTLVSAPTNLVKDVEMKKLTPIITVEQIEPCLSFWSGLGFETTVTVPHGDAMGFAMLQMGDVEIMYQSRASVDDDLGEAGQAAGFASLGEEFARSTSLLFIEVEAIDPLLAKLGDVAVVVPRRETFYGMDEIFVQAPCGTHVGFAARVEEG